MSDQEFQVRYKRLNTGQRQAVDTVEGPVMVIAGPGTGKTTVLTLRIANILRTTDTQPENILALTFTESGVVAMRKKLKEIIGVTAYRVPVYTFHGFANMIIQTYPESFEDMIGRTPLTDHEGALVIDTLLQTHVGEQLVPKNNPLFYSAHIRSAISTLKEASLGPEEYRAFLTREKEAIESSEDFMHQKGAHKGKVKAVYAQSLKRIEKSLELADFYEKYEAHLQRIQKYDFNDMILATVRTLQHDAVLLQTLQETYQYILADEHQDINTAQNTLIELLASFFDTPNLFVVGDDKQAIYRFQGASTENFVYLPKRFQEVQTVALTENYRSTQSILDASGTLIEVHTDLISSERLVACNEKGSEPVVIARAPDRRSELAYIVESIKETVARGVAPEDIAVLYRNNRHADAIQHELEKHGIATRVHSATDLFSHPLIWRLTIALRALSDLSNNELLSRLLLLGTISIETEKLYRVFEHARTRRTNILEALTHIAPECAQTIVELNTVLRTEGAIISIELLVKKLGFVEQAIALDPEGGFRALDTYFGLARTLQTENHAARGVDLVAHIDLYVDHGLRIKGTHGETESGKVNLMTAHNSKGLEFPIVYIVHVEHGIWGGKTNKRFFELPQLNASGTLEDERRLFYVAVTRAKQKVIITYARKEHDGKELLESQFIDELGDVCTTRETAPQVDMATHIASAQQSKPQTVTRDFVHRTLFQHGLAVTALNNYLACPWKFFFQNLLRVPHTPSPAQLFGTAMHEAFRVGQEQFQKEGSVLLEHITRVFEDVLKSLPLDATQLERGRTHGKNVIEAYINTYGAGAWVPEAQTEYSIRDVLMPIAGEELLLHGKIDRLEVLPDNKVRVVDYKTGKQKTRNQILGNTKDSNGDLIRQLTFYKLLLDAHKDGQYHMQDATLDFIEPNEKGDLRQESFTIEPEQVMQLKDDIVKVVTEITNLDFWNTRCDDEECEYCKLGEWL